MPSFTEVQVVQSAIPQHKSVRFYNTKSLLLLPTVLENFMTHSWVTLGCNNGGGGGYFSKVKTLVQKCKATRKYLFSGFCCFWPYPCGILEMQELFPRTYFAHKTTYAYLYLLIGCWNIQKNLESDVNLAGDGRFCRGFPPFCILVPRDQTCQLFYCT